MEEEAPVMEARNGRWLDWLRSAKWWIIAYITLIVLPGLMLLTFFDQRSNRILEEEVTRSMLQTIHQAALNVSYRLNHINDISNSLLMNPKVQENIRRSAGGSDIATLIDSYKELQALLASAGTNSDVFRIRLFIEPDSLLAGEAFNFLPLSQVEKRSWYPRVKMGNGAVYWTSVYEDNFIDQGAVPVISNARMLRNLHALAQSSGVLVVDVQAQLLQELIADIGISSSERVYMVDGEGTIVYHEDRARVDAQAFISEALKQGGSEGIISFQQNGEAAYAVFSTIGPTGWKLISEVSADEISRRSAQLNHYSGILTIVGVTLLFALLLFVLTAFMLRIMSARVQMMIVTIRRGGIDGIDPGPELRTGGRLYRLERDVAHLVTRVVRLMEETYRSKVLEREAQLRALQAQINPHFLYNTLDTINWMAIRKKVPDISAMIDALANYFRLSLNKGRDTVSVTDELKLVQVYLDIQMSRFTGEFEYHMEIEPGLERFMMPKLILQPIVENAVIHGIHNLRDRFGHISIEARRSGELIQFVIADNGVGMEQAQVDQLLTGGDSNERLWEKRGSSYGLYNANERLKLFFGEQYGIEFDSVPGEGTTVRLWFQERESET
jgi:two-component system sensor histidine kinase YesM